MKRFLIDHIDPLGQGVFKEDDQVYFIPKTLPGESGEFKILKKSKGVHFGELIKLEHKSIDRIDPLCPHFETCNGCHYLHVNYAKEKEFKLNSLRKILSSLKGELPEIRILENNERFGYRNRIQLHYDLSKDMIGFKKKNSNQIHAINNCLIAAKPLQQKLGELLLDGNWKKLLAKNAPKLGHIELYLQDEEINISCNQPYAQGGFSQVNSKVNLLLQNEIKSIFSNRELSILDLFGGGGNLLSGLDCRQKLSVDLYPRGAKAHQLHLDLFSEDALELFLENHSEHFNTVFVDPPRSGFKELNNWILQLNPEQILYVSCHPATMVRDLVKLEGMYVINKIYLIEFFPGTFHFEAAVVLNKSLN